MSNFISNPIFTLFLLPLIGTIFLAGITSLDSRSTSGAKLLSAATGVGTAWVCAFVLGIPDFPPAFNISSMPYIILAGLLTGALLDQILPEFGDRRRIPESALDLVFAALVIWWVHGGIDLWAFLIFIVWGSISVRARQLAKDPRLPATMMVIAAIGLAVVAWIGDSLVNRDLAFGVASAGLGISTWLWLKRHLSLGFGFFWGGFAALMLIAIRILETNKLMVVPILLLVFIFFADSVVSRASIRPVFLQQFPASVLVCALSILPIILAAAAALVAASLLVI